MRNFDKIHNYHQASVNGEFIWPFFHVKSIIVYVFPLNLQIVQTITMKTFISGNFFKCLHYILCRYNHPVKTVIYSGKELDCENSHYPTPLNILFTKIYFLKVLIIESI
jgi:hypothetical protein